MFCRGGKENNSMSEKMKIDLNGKVAIVTGAGGVIGTAISKTLAANGAKVVLSDIAPAKERLEELCGEIHAEGAECTYAFCDVSNKEDCAALVDFTVKTYGSLEILCNNAGINVGAADRKNFWEYRDEIFEKIIAVDVMSVYYLSKPAAKYMVENGIKGSIINTASICGVVPLRYQLAYNGAKAAVIQMTKAIRVNSLAPGSTMNPQLMEVFYHDKERAEGMLSHFPLGRTADPYEQAAMVAFFASDDASYVTGLTGLVDGGWVCGFNRNTEKTEI